MLFSEPSDATLCWQASYAAWLNLSRGPQTAISMGLQWQSSELPKQGYDLERSSTVMERSHMTAGIVQF